MKKIIKTFSLESVEILVLKTNILIEKTNKNQVLILIRTQITSNYLLKIMKGKRNRKKKIRIIRIHLAKIQIKLNCKVISVLKMINKK